VIGTKVVYSSVLTEKIASESATPVTVLLYIF